MKFAALLTLCLFLPVAAQAEPMDAQHKTLAGLSGHWSVRQSLWLDGATTPKTDCGTADFAMVLNGRHLRQTLHIADGTGFEGLGYIGYDPASARFFSTWMDINFPGLVVAYGGFDDTEKAYVFRGTMSADVQVREVMTIADVDHFRYYYYEAHGAAENLTVRLDYTRATDGATPACR